MNVINVTERRSAHNFQKTLPECSVLAENYQMLLSKAARVINPDILIRTSLISLSEH